MNTIYPTITFVQLEFVKLENILNNKILEIKLEKY